AALALALVYWVFVILGAVDIDLFGGEDAAIDAASAKADGMLDALSAKGDAADGALEGLAGKADAIDAVAAKGEALDALEGAEGAGEGAANLLHAFSLRRAPVTVTFSIVALFAFVFSYLGASYLGPVLGAVMPALLAETAVLVIALALSLPLASLATKPLEPIFRHRGGARRKDFVGTVCRVQTGRVSDRFGQATVEDGGAGLVIPVRIDTGELERGDRALIVDYDAEREAYVIEAYDDLLKEETRR
ncbi:MAG: glycine zipper family protein, partial [Polyangiaceae bacterium]